MNHALTVAWISGGIICGGMVVALLTLLAVRLSRYRAAENFELQDFSISRYEPMARLFSEEDLAFLASQPGYRPEIGAKLRRDRLRIFRMYLKDLAADFQALHGEARKMAAISPEQHSQLVGALVRQQFTFWHALVLIELRLTVPNSGVAMGEIRGLIASVETMRLQLSAISIPAV